MTKQSEPEVFESSIGPLTAVAEKSFFKPLFGGLFWGLLGGFLLYGAFYMFWFEIPTLIGNEQQPNIPLLILIGMLFIIGYLFFTVLIRRFKASRDKTLYFRAGTGGVSVCFPSGIKIFSLLLSYKTETKEIAWNDIKTWYPFRVNWHGIPMGSQIKFEGEDWGFAVDTRYFKGKRRKITDALSAARKKEASSGTPAVEKPEAGKEAEPESE